jgi:hypothetical protein
MTIINLFLKKIHVKGGYFNGSGPADMIRNLGDVRFFQRSVGGVLKIPEDMITATTQVSEEEEEGRREGREERERERKRKRVCVVVDS